MSDNITTRIRNRIHDAPLRLRDTLDDALAEIEKLRTTLDVKWQPMSTAPMASGADVILLIQRDRKKHAETGCRTDWSDTGWMCTDSQHGTVWQTCEPLGWWPIPKIED